MKRVEEGQRDLKRHTGDEAGSVTPGVGSRRRLSRPARGSYAVGASSCQISPDNPSMAVIPLASVAPSVMTAIT